MSELENKVNQITNLPTDVFKAAVVMSLSDPSVRIVPLSMTEASAEFDRWLAEVKAQAWEEGCQSAVRNITFADRDVLDVNPYQGENK